MLSTRPHLLLTVGMPLDLSKLACMSSAQLSKFEFGAQKDNALTTAIRRNELQVFMYLLKRGISPLCADVDNATALHYAVLPERGAIENRTKLKWADTSGPFISFLFESDPSAFQDQQVDLGYG